MTEANVFLGAYDPATEEKEMLAQCQQTARLLKAEAELSANQKTAQTFKLKDSFC